MLLSPVRKLARKLGRRVVYGALTFVLLSATVGAAVTGSLIFLLLAFAPLLGILAVTVRDVRVNRIMVHQLRWRLHSEVNRAQPKPEQLRSMIEQLRSTTQQLRSTIRALEKRLDELEVEAKEAHALLAVSLLNQESARPSLLERTTPLFADAAVLALLRRRDALDAYSVATGSGRLTSFRRGTLRMLRNELRRRGYLTKALEIAKALRSEDDDDDRDLIVRRQIQGEIAVMSGDFTPTVRREAPGYKPRQGRVLHLVGRSLPADQVGYTLRTHYIATAQQAAGLDPHVVTQMGYAHEGEDYAREVLDGITYHRIPGPQRNQVQLDVWMRMHVQRVANLVRVVRPAVLHAASDFVNAQTAIAVGKEFGLPVIYESRGFWEETWLSRTAEQYRWNLPHIEAAFGLPETYVWRRAIEDRLRREADHVVTLDRVMAERIEAGGVPSHRISIVPNGVAVDEFPVLARNGDLAAQLGIDDNVTVIGYISSLVEYEGIDILISAYAEVKKSTDSPVMLLIVGEGPVRERLMHHADSYGLDDVIFTGQVPHSEVTNYYSLIDIFVVPRRPVDVCHLVTPLKPFEAFSTGRVVVLSDVRALAAIARQSDAAELFEAGSVQSLANVLSALLADPERRRQLAARGVSWVRSERTWDRNAEETLHVYDRLGVSLKASTGHVSSEVDLASVLDEVSPEKLVRADDTSLVSGRQVAVDEAAGEPAFLARPFVCGAIGHWDDTTVERMRASASLELNVVHSSNMAVILSNQGLNQWRFGEQRGYYWSPLAFGGTPTSWQSAAQERLAAGLVLDSDSAILHSCGLGLQEMYVREVGNALYFSSRVMPLLTLADSPLHANPVAWASILAFGCPIGDATPFAEVRRIDAATAWRFERGRGGVRRLSFEPTWLASEPTSPPAVDDVIDAIVAQLPRSSQVTVSVPLSGGRDSRLLAALAARYTDYSPSAWTTPTDDGRERDLPLSGPVADSLGIAHRIVAPSLEDWRADATRARDRFQYQTWYHTWMVSLARSLHQRGDVVVDGLGGDVLLGGLFAGEHISPGDSSSVVREALWRQLSSSRIERSEAIEPKAQEMVRRAALTAFNEAIAEFSDSPNMSTLSVLRTRTTRAIAASPICLLGPEVEVLIPYLTRDVIAASLRVPLQSRADGSFYRKLLMAGCGPFVAGLPSTKDVYRSKRRVRRRQTSVSSLNGIVESISADAYVCEFLHPDLRSALRDHDVGLLKQMCTSQGTLVTLQWADMFAEWRRRHSSVLADEGVNSIDFFAS